MFVTKNCCVVLISAYLAVASVPAFAEGPVTNDFMKRVAGCSAIFMVISGFAPEKWQGAYAEMRQKADQTFMLANLFENGSARKKELHDARGDKLEYFESLIQKQNSEELILETVSCEFFLFKSQQELRSGSFNELTSFYGSLGDGRRPSESELSRAKILFYRSHSFPNGDEAFGGFVDPNDPNKVDQERIDLFLDVVQSGLNGWRDAGFPTPRKRLKQLDEEVEDFSNLSSAFNYLPDLAASNASSIFAAQGASAFRCSVFFRILQDYSSEYDDHHIKPSQVLMLTAEILFDGDQFPLAYKASLLDGSFERKVLSQLKQLVNEKDHDGLGRTAYYCLSWARSILSNVDNSDFRRLKRYDSASDFTEYDKKILWEPRTRDQWSAAGNPIAEIPSYVWSAFELWRVQN